jgi:hypothetical protein
MRKNFGIRLLKYQVSKKHDRVILFFMQRNGLKESAVYRQEMKQTGLYFFTVLSFDELINISK